MARAARQQGPIPHEGTFHSALNARQIQVYEVHVNATVLTRQGWRALPISLITDGGVVGASEFMNEKIRYADEPLGRLRVVPDFLPPAEDLAFRDEGVKVTIALSNRSVDFLKSEARKHHTQYPRMIRRLLHAYAEHHTRPLTGRSRRRRARVARAG